MSLELLLNIICDLAIKRNLVNYAAAGPSIYGLNADTIKDYPFIFASPTSNVVTRKNFTDYTLTLFYVDRLLADLTNETHIFSIANDTLVNLLRQLKQLDGIVDISEPTVRLFTDTERMSDRCAGGYTEVTITVLNDAECPVIFDETGEPIGTYIPNTLKDLNILDSLASKPWVIQYVADHSGGSSSGGTDEREVKRLIAQALRDYTKTEDFATINGSGITSGETYNLVEKSDFETFYSSYTGDLASVYAAISAATPEDYGALRTQVSANTGNISTISGATVGNIENITELSAFTSGLSFTVNEHTENIEQISALTQTLSGETSDLRAFLGDLSASTSSAVSSLTEGLETLSGATVALSGATTGIASDLADLSSGVTDLSSGLTALSGVVQTLGSWGIVYDFGTWSALPSADKAAMRAQWTAEHAEGKKVYLKATTTGNEIVYLLLEGTGTYDQFRYASDAYVCHLSINNSKAIGQSGGKVNKTNIITTDVKAKTTQLGCVKIGSGLTIDNQGVLSGPGGNVSSTSVFTIWSGSQAAYSALGTYDNNTLYVIKDANT